MDGLRWQWIELHALQVLGFVPTPLLSVLQPSVTTPEVALCQDTGTGENAFGELELSVEQLVRQVWTIQCCLLWDVQLQYLWPSFSQTSMIHPHKGKNVRRESALTGCCYVSDCLWVSHTSCINVFPCYMPTGLLQLWITKALWYQCDICIVQTMSFCWSTGQFLLKSTAMAFWICSQIKRIDFTKQAFRT